MTLRQYLTSKSFFKQLLLAFGIVIVLVFLLLQWLSYATDHGNEITVPDLRKLTEQQVEEKLDELNLEYVLLDTVDYNKDFPKYTVVQQDPLPGSKVKDGRKIYIKVNSADFRMVTMPDLIEKTLRQTESSLMALGLEVGKKTYKPYLGKDMVLEMYADGKKLKVGDKVKKASKIDLVLGDGKVGFEESETDTIKNTDTETAE
ncbi:PASTA domain-containing protein [Flavobacterium lindanitolerans]|uniref:PASTA domain-containing protein n=1 Tax=Flavobacterium lindanitolerans TaxID=428988 RepID=A0A497UZL1_9FLAO|nr:PASTA domain-containing protein [Flavobacterium lindanitolerans]MBC8644166.1 PASTA domain-containing protein [Flavobacterium lindanitolerans]PKW21259.1 PASTA domain-containing protein [Flavobacterium lindanitolerans]RLJ30103.1 PASTA domain-containing protein [Flavobacterium lindanitolerans]